MYYVFGLVVLAIIAATVIKLNNGSKCNRECNQGRNCNCRK